MITPIQIQRVSDEIALKFQPDRIILFGSYAYGTPTEDSDVDLLVVLPFEGRATRKSIEIQTVVPIRFPVDLIAITPHRLEERIEMGDCFLQEITQKGRELYADKHAGLGRAR